MIDLKPRTSRALSILSSNLLDDKAAYKAYYLPYDYMHFDKEGHLLITQSIYEFLTVNYSDFEIGSETAFRR